MLEDLNNFNWGLLMILVSYSDKFLMKWVCFLIITLATNAFGMTLNYDEQRVFSEIVKDLMDFCPPSECVYVGVGRSPTVVMKVLEEQEGLKPIHLPLTYGRELKSENRDLTTNERKRIYKHFDNFIPTDIDGKKVVLIDYTQTGAGIDLADKHLSEWSRERNLKFSIGQYRMTPDYFELEKNTNRKRVFKLSGRYSEIATNLAKRKYSRFSKYDPFQITTSNNTSDYNPPRLNKQYKSIKVKPKSFKGICIGSILDKFLSSSK